VIPFQVQEEFLIPSEMLFYHGVGSAEVSINDNWRDKISLFIRAERSLIQLSKDLTETRLGLLSKVRSAYVFFEITTLVSITIGMITTILVSISSTDFGRGDGKYQRLIRVLAIIFPALGTATAAVIGFYSPQAAWGQASRTLASVTQLHDHMALAVWKVTCPTADTNDSALTPVLDDWSRRYTDIQTISNASGTPDGNQGNGGQGNGGPANGGPANGNRIDGSQTGGNQPGAINPAGAPARPGQNPSHRP
jgi:hypothetical protein